jgi:hypothetical protein
MSAQAALLALCMQAAVVKARASWQGLLLYVCVAHMTQPSGQCSVPTAAALAELGVKVLLHIDKDFHLIFTDWINLAVPVKLELTHSTKEVVAQLIKQTQNS